MSGGGSGNQAGRIFNNVFGGQGVKKNLGRFVNTFQQGAQGKGDFMGCAWSGLNALYDAVSSEEVALKKRRFRIVKTLGEGGFAFVYLVKEVGRDSASSSSTERPAHVSEDGSYALKKVLVQTKEQLSLVKAEISAASKFNHPNLLPLIDHTLLPAKDGKEAYMLFPVYQEGTLQDQIAWMTDSSKEKKERLSSYNLLHIFQQMCAGIGHMHSSAPPFAHNDMKPGNVLVSRRGPHFHVSIMDFGSASPARRQIRSRSDALNLQEWAAQHCSAGYRAPEFWDCPSNIDVDERSDVWSLGCTLYALMYGLSPFEHSLGESGGSIQLAVMSGSIKWPALPRLSHPPEVKDLITWMLNVDASQRPWVKDVSARVEKIIATLPPPETPSM